MLLHRALYSSFIEVFRNLRYVGVAIGFSFVAFATSLWLHNVSLLKTALFSPLFTAADKLALLFRLLGGITTNVTTFSAVLIVAMSLIFGMNAALLIYSLLHCRKTTGMYTTGTVAGGILSAIFGAGCASCGTYLLGSALTSLGASGLLAFLPLGGQEFLIASIALLAVSIIGIAKSMMTPAVCPVIIRPEGGETNA